MQTDAALLAAIRRAPEDDTPRLVYADWLDDYGDPARAEFIRVQCALARWPPYLDNPGSWSAIRAGPPDQGYLALWQRNWELVHKFGLQWSHPFPSLDKHTIFVNGPSSTSTVPYFGRGFLESVFVLPRLLPEAIAAIRASPEPIRHLWVRATSDPGDRAVHPRLRSQVGDAGVRILADADGLDRIESLHLRFGDIGPAGMEALTGVRSLARLEVLDLYMNRLGDDGVRMLARSLLFRQLKVLGLGCNNIGPVGLRALLEASAAGGLELLYFVGNYGSSDLGQLVRELTPGSPAIRRLTVAHPWGYAFRTLRDMSRGADDPT